MSCGRLAAAGPSIQCTARFAADTSACGGNRVQRRRRFVVRNGDRAHGVRSAASLTNSSTSCAWPGTFTPRHSRAELAVPSIRNVLRSMPRTCLPYMFFILMTPNCAHSFSSGSEMQLERKSHLALKLLVRLQLSRDTPTTTAPACANCRAGRGTARLPSCSPACCPSDRSTARPDAPRDRTSWNAHRSRRGEVVDFRAHHVPPAKLDRVTRLRRGRRRRGIRHPARSSVAAAAGNRRRQRLAARQRQRLDGVDSRAPDRARSPAPASRSAAARTPARAACPRARRAA